MKRSKLFLGATTAVLAIAGVAAAKHYGDSVQRFYITKNSGYCQGVVSTCTKTAGANQCFFTVVAGAIVTRYPLLTKGPAGVRTASNCLVPLTYLNEH